LEAEYRCVRSCCRGSGRKDSALSFGAWSSDGKTKLADSGPLEVAFTSAPAVQVKLRVKDDDGKSERDGRPVMGAFTFTDSQGRTYPAQSRRLAPDFSFHPQVYRGDGESILLQPGKYKVSYTRGPEYLILKKEITVPAASTHS